MRFRRSLRSWRTAPRCRCGLRAHGRGPPWEGANPVCTAVGSGSRSAAVATIVLGLFASRDGESRGSAGTPTGQPASPVITRERVEALRGVGVALAGGFAGLLGWAADAELRARAGFESTSWSGASPANPPTWRGAQTTANRTTQMEQPGMKRPLAYMAWKNTSSAACARAGGGSRWRHSPVRSPPAVQGGKEPYDHGEHPGADKPPRTRRRDHVAASQW